MAARIVLQHVAHAELQEGFLFDTLASCDDTKQPLVGQTLLSVRDDVALQHTQDRRVPVLQKYGKTAS